MIKMAKDEYSRRIKKAIVELQSKQPFFAYIAMNMKIIETDRVPTMGVDGKLNLYYNKSFVEDSLKNQNLLVGCICHEVLHQALDHIGRLGSRYLRISNIAQDMVVNMICATNNLSIPQGKGYVNVDTRYNTGSITLGVSKIEIQNITEKSWERIYLELISKFPNPAEIEKSLNGGTNFVFDKHMHEEFEKLSKEDQNSLKEKMNGVLVNGYTIAKQAGNMPGNMNLYIDSLLKPKIQWESKLRAYIKQSIDPHDWTYRRPHRKSHALNIYTPSVLRESIEVCAVIDTSGSISKDLYTKFITEMWGLLRSYSSLKLNIIFGDTQINEEYDLRSADANSITKLPVSGRGGTDIENMLIQVKENKKKNNNLVIVLSDGETRISKTKNYFPFEIIWILPETGNYNHITYGNKIFI